VKQHKKEIKMKKVMCGIDILEMTANGLQLIANLPTEEELEDPDGWVDTLNHMAKTAYDNDKMVLTTEDVAFCIRGLDKKTIVFKGVFKIISKEEDKE
jgi:hypothetical protein